MKTTKYFEFRRTLPDRELILNEWIEEVLKNPSRNKVQDDLWGKVAQAGDKYLRVIILEDGQTVHNAFFDRSYKE